LAVRLGAGLVVGMLILVPVASGATPTTTFVAPFTGFGASLSHYAVSSWCPHTHGKTLAESGFNRTTGRIREGASVWASACPLTSQNLSANFSASAFDYIRVSSTGWKATFSGWVNATVNLTVAWTVNISTYLGTHSGSPFADYQAAAWGFGYDATSNVYIPTWTGLYNETYFDSVTGNYSANLRQNVSSFIPMKLIRGHWFVLEVIVYVDATVWVGPGNSRAHASVDMGTRGNGAVLTALDL
ncbi:MAG: hypothetical protein L3K19_05385, partial [Thermoplasmata archaeon]|nr:hypothetical protein [Thermoplasmata archaeon]